MVFKGNKIKVTILEMKENDLFFREVSYLCEYWNNGHLARLADHPGKAVSRPPHQLVHVVAHLGLIGAAGGEAN